MIRLGAALERISVEHYGAFYAGHYRTLRNSDLLEARIADGAERCRRIRLAIEAHRNMMRCWRELRRAAKEEL